MEFFRTQNPKLFKALTKEPLLYNLQVDSYGINIIHLPSQTLQYPLVLRDFLANLKENLQKNTNENITNNSKEYNTITPQTHVSSMFASHKDLAQDPMRHPKWRLFVNFNPNITSNFINEERLPITGKACNAILKTSIQSVYDSMEECSKNTTSQYSHTLQHNLTNGINTLLDNNLLESFETMKFLPQTSIYGLMGGIFLQDLLLQGYHFHSLMIYEEHIDFFRISLYFLDYAQLFSQVSKQACFIMIKDISEPLIKAFFTTKRLTNNLIGLELQHYDTQNVQTIKSLVAKEKKAIMRGWGSFEDELIGFKNAVQNLHSCKILHQPKRINAPICVVGNGASLDLCLDFIKEYQDSMIILSCGTALKVLRYHNIKPDFQIEIERIDYLADVLQEAGLEDIPLIFAQMTDTKAVNLSKESYGFMRGGSASAYFEMSFHLCHNKEKNSKNFDTSTESNQTFSLELSAPFVGNAGVALAALLGSDILLCGLDCGYIEGFSKHAKNSFYGKEKVEIPKDCFQVSANKNLKVFSNDLFYLSANNIASAIQHYNPNTAINLGYGAYIANTLSLNEDDFSLQKIDKLQAIHDFKKNFQQAFLDINTKEIFNIAKQFLRNLESLLIQEAKNIGDLYTKIDSIESLLQQEINDFKRRKSVILFEGSSLHLCFSLLLAYLFAGKKECYGIMQNEIKQVIQSMLQELCSALQDL
ncbi:hypothetical protein CQA53_06465 [Helicobacter didelphidarum]|uniref:DUF115 domain-containing protein n=2 Tax=Helicobacter didelphidarum TaxID=2040648 RepID=A0A3D8IKE2_9HELI|nr:hypothetical protein CQA53_06465 [Helicobacter didelphidarum]